MKKEFLLTIISTVLVSCASVDVRTQFIRKNVRNITSIEKTALRQNYKDYESISLIGKGNIKVAVIPIWFLDSKNYLNPVDKYKIRQDINDAFFGEPSDVGWESVKSFYETESEGTFHLSGKTSYWYEYEGLSTEFYELRNVNALIDITEWFFESNPEQNRLDYDADNDGFLDIVSFIYAAPDSITAGRMFDDKEYDNMWAYRTYASETSSDVNKPNLKTYFWASYDFLRDGSQCIDEIDGHSRLDTTIFIHEFGHCFGLLDYYDYNHVANPAGSFSMQDRNVGSHDPYSVMAIGWADPYIPTESMVIELGAFQKTHEMILLTPEWNENDSPFDEYMLLELYTPTGLNEFHDKYGREGFHRTNTPSNVGIRLWHVDATLTYRSELETGAKFTTDAHHYNTGHAYSNTYYKEDGSGNGHVTQLGKNYDQYNLLECIQADSNYVLNYDSFAPYEQSLFTANTGFTLDSELAGTYVYNPDTQTNCYYHDNSAQFVNKNKLNNNKELGWSFEVVSITNEGHDSIATIKLIKS